MSDMASDPSTLTRLLSQLAKDHPRRETLISHILSLLTSSKPSFVYLHDALTPNLTCRLLRDILAVLSDTDHHSTRTVYAFVNCVAAFTSRILFDIVINALVEWEGTWAEGCSVWRGESGQGVSWNDSFDGFLHGLRAVHSEALRRDALKGGITSSASLNRVKIVVVFERVERLRETLPSLIMPLSRLSELTQLDISTIFVSDIPWDDVCPSPGAFPDPFRIEVDPPTRQDTLFLLVKSFPSETPSSPISAYNPILQPLFSHFVGTVYDVCSPFIQDPQELAYIVSARWPGFVAPVLEDWKAQDHGPFTPPSEDARMRLTRLFNISLTSAMETVYPRFMSAVEWSSANAPPAGFRLSQSIGRQLPLPTSVSQENVHALELPRMSIFILVAAFLASFNPAKTDVRMLGRAPDGSTRKRRKGGGTRKTKPGSIAKIPQRLLGPMPFPLDRLIAILGSLLLEYDADNRQSNSRSGLAGELTEVEVYRVMTTGSILELVSMRLLYRTTPEEKIDGPPMFKCAISYDLALRLARKIDIPLNDLMWEPN